MKKRILAASMAALLLLSAAGCGGKKDAGPVKIATKPITEQYILGEMLSLLIEDAGYKTEIAKGVGGGTSNIQPAMEKGILTSIPSTRPAGT